MPEKTILIVSNFYPPHFVGGAELIAHYHARELQRAGWRVHVFAGEGHASGVRYTVAHQEYEGVPVDRIHLNPQDFSPQFLNFFHPEVEARFAETLEHVRPDVVHMHNIIGLSAGMARQAAERGIPVIVTLHDHWGHCLKNTIILQDETVCQDFTRCAECQLFIPDERNLNAPIRMRNDYLDLQMQHVSAFISPSQYLADGYIKAGWPKDRMHVIWNGIDLDRFSRVAKIAREDCVRFSYIGYLGEHKGLGVLLEALKITGPPRSFRVNLVGEGHMRPLLEKKIAELGLGDQVKFWGKVPHGLIEQVFEQTDVQLMPSIWPENQPVTITEAMASRTAVLASRIGGIPELVEDGLNGLLFEKGNAADLAEKMVLFAQQPGLADSFGRNGFERIKNFTFKHQVARMTDLYERQQGMPSCEPARPLVLCCGPRFDERGFRALDEIRVRIGLGRHMFVMSNWVPPRQQARATAVLVLPGARAGEVTEFLRMGLPIIVPQEAEDLVALCRTYDCGLPYHTFREAVECIEWLIWNREDRALLGKNAAVAVSVGSGS